jgi:hypothetical protein
MSLALTRYNVFIPVSEDNMAICRLSRLLPAMFLFVFSASCADFWVNPSSVGSVTVSPDAIFLDANGSDSKSLTASATTVGGSTANNPSISWKSSDTSVATVPTGPALTETVTDVTAVGGKTAVITASSGSKSATCQVYAYTGTVSITVTASSTTFTSGTTGTITLTAKSDLNGNTGVDITQYVDWKISSGTGATVVSEPGNSSNGTVTINGATANVEVTATAHLSSGDQTGNITLTAQ